MFSICFADSIYINNFNHPLSDHNNETGNVKHKRTWVVEVVAQSQMAAKAMAAVAQVVVTG